MVHGRADPRTPVASPIAAELSALPPSWVSLTDVTTKFNVARSLARFERIDRWQQLAAMVRRPGTGE
jgi:hypothetical protein